MSTSGALNVKPDGPKQGVTRSLGIFYLSATKIEYLFERLSIRINLLVSFDPLRITVHFYRRPREHKNHKIQLKIFCWNY